MNLAKHIAYLLFEHDCVIVPGWGAFIVNRKGVDIDHQAQLASPAKRLVSFNANIQQNDGLLAHHIATRQGSTYDVAMSQLLVEIEKLRGQLNTHRNLELPAIGTFYITHDEKQLFIPDHLANFSKESYGLPKVRLQTHAKAQVAERPSVDQRSLRSRERRDKVAETRVQRKVVRSKSARTLPIVNVLGAVFMLAMFFGILNFEVNGNYDKVLAWDTADMVDTPSNDKVEVVRAHTFSIFEIATASLNTEDEAQNLLISLQDKYRQARIVTHADGGYSVSIISFSNEALAREYLELLQHRINHQLEINTK